MAVERRARLDVIARRLPFGFCPLLLLLLLALKADQDGRVEDFLEVLLRERRTLEVGDGAQVTCQSLGIARRHRSLAVRRQFDEHSEVGLQVALSADEHDRHLTSAAVMPDVRHPLVAHVDERRG